MTSVLILTDVRLYREGLAEALRAQPGFSVTAFSSCAAAPAATRPDNTATARSFDSVVFMIAPG